MRWPGGGGSLLYSSNMGCRRVLDLVERRRILEIVLGFIVGKIWSPKWSLENSDTRQSARFACRR